MSGIPTKIQPAREKWELIRENKDKSPSGWRIKAVINKLTANPHVQ
ncbi:hypothetical protein [Bacillus sp. J33]|nr:hypothetical protein [Bacillus sp. J33]